MYQPLKSDDTSGAHGLTGDAHKRFVIVTSLLYLIDPVRGESTAHSLDRHPHDSNWKLENLQKKFLDSFALICSTSRIGGRTASAVCLEQGHPAGNVLRLARNLGVPQDLVIQLQKVLNNLSAVAANRLYHSNVVHPPDGDSGCETACGNDPSKLITRAD